MTHASPLWGKIGQRLFWDVHRHIGLVTASGLMLFVLVDFVEKSNLASTQELTDVLILELYSLPLIFLRIVMLTAVVGSAITLGGWMRRQELVALFSAGASPLLVFKAFLLASLGWVTVWLTVTEGLAPQAFTESAALRRKLGLAKRMHRISDRGRWFRGQDALYRVEHLARLDGSRLEGVLMLRLSDGRLRERWDIDTLRHTDQGWRAENVLHRVFTASALTTRHNAVRPVSLQEAPEDFVRTTAAPPQMRLGALARTVRAQTRLGQDSTRHRWALYRRLLDPLQLMCAVLLGAGVALRLGRQPAFIHTAGSGAAFGFALWFIDELALTLTTSGATIPEITVLFGPLGILGATGWVWQRAFTEGIREY